MFANIYKDKKVLITGDTGFKGSWLSQWLLKLGAEIKGFSHYNKYFHYSILNNNYETTIGDLRDFKELFRVLKYFKPDLIFHMGAQPLVGPSYDDPLETFEVNTLGTLNLFECVRNLKYETNIINITTDKVYRNNENKKLFLENDSLGGYDPYSASKSCAQIVSDSYKYSFFPIEGYNKTHKVLISNVIAGNVIGGGDWGVKRLVPDIIKYLEGFYTEINFRNIYAIRPWQHVLDCLYGYLLVGQKLLEKNINLTGSYNFGGSNDKEVIDIIEYIEKYWGSKKLIQDNVNPEFKESNILRLNSCKAKLNLGWENLLSFDDTLQYTCNWYRTYFKENKILTLEQIIDYEKIIRSKRWELSN